jgi:glycosyltransferase involved in cell wall biosynthesis
MDTKNLFYSTPNFSAFIRKDIAIFEKEYRVRVFLFRSRPKWITPLSFLHQLVLLVWRFRSTSIQVCQFGGYHALLPALFSRFTRKPCLIITSGTDCVAFPSLRYGHFQRRVLGTFTRWAYSWCTHIAAVHRSLIHAPYTYQPDDYPEQGIRAFCKNIRTPMSEIPYGYDTDYFYNTGSKKRPRSFITIAVGATSALRYRLKGIDLTVWAAGQFPDCSFTIVGAENMPQSQPPANVKLLGIVKPEELRQLLSEHEFYLQLSISEGFPNALCEAMLCECIPIGSAVAAIPDIIGETGFILQRRDTELLRGLIRTALRSDKKKLSKSARQRIVDNFPLEKRSRSLLTLSSSLLTEK